jgi:hypothetical protein
MEFVFVYLTKLFQLRTFRSIAENYDSKNQSPMVRKACVRLQRLSWSKRTNGRCWSRKPFLGTDKCIWNFRIQTNSAVLFNKEQQMGGI